MENFTGYLFPKIATTKMGNSLATFQKSTCFRSWPVQSLQTSVQGCTIKYDLFPKKATLKRPGSTTWSQKSTCFRSVAEVRSASDVNVHWYSGDWLSCSPVGCCANYGSLPEEAEQMRRPVTCMIPAMDLHVVTAAPVEARRALRFTVTFAW